MQNVSFKICQSYKKYSFGVSTSSLNTQNVCKMCDESNDLKVEQNDGVQDAIRACILYAT